MRLRDFLTGKSILIILTISLVMLAGLSGAVLILTTCQNPLQEVIAKDILGGLSRIIVKQGGVELENTEGVYDFGNCRLGETKTAEFTLENSGDAPLILNADAPVLLEGDNSSEFQIISQPGTTIAEGASSSFSIGFSPESFSEKKGIVTIKPSADDADGFSFRIAGSAPGPEMVLKQGDTEIPSGGVYDLGGVQHGSSLTASFSVENRGYDILHFTGSPKVSITGNDYASFIYSDPLPDSISPGESASFSVVFSPDKVGEYSVNVSISNNAVSDSGCIFSITGRGLLGDERITNDAASSSYPSLVWTGTEYGVCWSDYRNGNYEIYFARLDVSGIKIGDDVRITDAIDNSTYPSLVWNGKKSEYGVCWSDYRDGNDEIYFARIGEKGAKIGNDVRITNDAHYSQDPSLVWTGTEYAVCWSDKRDGDDSTEIYFARIDELGIKIGSDEQITDNTNISEDPSLVWTGIEYGLCWLDRPDGMPEVYFTRVDSEGVKIGNDLRLTYHYDGKAFPSVVWTGTEYGVCWQDNRDGAAKTEIYFTRMDALGNKIESNLQITNALGLSIAPSLVWTGTEYGVSWGDDRDGNSEIYFAILDASGTKLGDDVRITYYSGYSRYPTLVWIGTEYAVSWMDERDGNYEIYFTIFDSHGEKQ